jgi:predicted Zn-dependent protease
VNAWPFVSAAYAATIVGTVALAAQSWLAMRRAEAAADRLGRDK